MFRRVLGAGVAAVAVVAGLAAPQTAEAAEQPEPVRVLIVGDSVTHGRVGDYTWRYHLWSHIEAAGRSVDFVGPHTGVMNHDTGDREDPGYADPNFDTDHASRWGMGFATQEFPIAELVTVYQPDIVVEMLGTNDLVWYGRTQDDVAASASEFVREAREAKPDVSIVLGHVPNGGWVGGADGANWWLDAIARDRDRPDARVAATVPPASWVQGVDTYDSLHPSAVGEVKLAEVVGAAIDEVWPEPVPAVRALTRAPRLSVRELRGPRVRLSWTVPARADGVRLWRRVGGGEWRRALEFRHRESRVVREHRVRVRWRLEAFNDVGVSPRSNVVTVKRRK